jgi:hypothetical protein
LTIQNLEIKEWVKKVAEGDIAEYARASRKITLKWVIGHLKFLISWGLTEEDVEEILKKIRENSGYKPIQNEENLRRLDELKIKIKEELFK